MKWRHMALHHVPFDASQRGIAEAADGENSVTDDA
jgi:hypothetical protein